MVKKLLITLVLVLAMCVTVQASSLDFGVIAPTPGTIDYGTTSNTRLVGTNIQVDNVTGLGTPFNNGTTLPITGGLLDFISGPITGTDPLHWDFVGAGPISITGAILGGLNEVLMSGTFTEVHVVDGVTPGTFEVAIAAFFDRKAEDLAHYFYDGGFPTLWDGNLNISFQVAANITPGIGNYFISTQVLSGDVVNNPVPIPPSVLLMGSGLLGIGLIGWRRKRD
jgi:hypothetical protein